MHDRSSNHGTRQFRSLVRLALILSVALASAGAAAAQGITELISVTPAGLAGNGQAQRPSISRAGNLVAFQSVATDLVTPAPPAGIMQIYLRNRTTGSTVLVSQAGSVPGDHDSRYPRISADGQYITFESDADNLDPGVNTNGVTQVYRFGISSHVIDVISTDASGTPGQQPSGWPSNSTNPSISADGDVIAFHSLANLAGPTSSVSQIFVRTVSGGPSSITLVSADPTSGAPGDQESQCPALSGDGTFVAFHSDATNLIPGQGPTGCSQVIGHSMNTGLNVLVSSIAGAPASQDASMPAVSFTGRYVAFHSGAPNLGATSFMDIFWRDMNGVDPAKLTTWPPSRGSMWPAISEDGQTVAYETAMVVGLGYLYQHVYTVDVNTLVTTERDVDSVGTMGNGLAGYPTYASLSGAVAFESTSTNLTGGTPPSVTPQVYVNEGPCTGSIFTYCTAKMNSLGCLPAIGSSGEPSQSGPDNFYVTASNVLNNKLGMMLWSQGQASFPFFGGTLCLQSPITRTPAQLSGGTPTGNDCSGTYSYHFSQAYMLQHLLAGNTTVYAQYWSRDPGFGIPNNIGLTNALSFTICP